MNKIFSTDVRFWTSFTSCKLILLVFTLNILSCTEKSNLKNPLISNIYVNLDKVEIIKYSSVYNDIRYVKLETTDSNLLGFVNKICVSDTRLYMLSPSPINTISVFEMDGRFLYQIKRIGKGPGEYTDLQDIQVNEFIWLLDHYNKKLIKYSLDGEFLNEILIKIWADRFEFLNKDTIIFFSNNRYNEIQNKICNYQLLFMDVTSQEIIDFSLPFNRNFEAIYVRDYSNFSIYNHLISFNHSYNDTIFSINNKMKVSPRYHINFGKYKIPDEVFKKKYQNAKDFSMKIVRSDYVYRFGNNFRELKNVMFFCFVHKMKLHHLLISKKTGNIRCFNNYISDIEGYSISKTLDIEFQPLAVTKSEMVFLIEPQTFISTINEQKKMFDEIKWQNFKESNPYIIDLFENTTSMDNPILAFYEIKDF